MATKKSKKAPPTEYTKKLGPRFAANTQRLREKAGMSRTKLAEKLQLSPSMITKMESKDPENRRDPSLYTVEATAKVLGVDPVVLMAEVRKKIKKKVAKAVQTAEAQT